MTYGEIIDTLKAAIKKRENVQKEKAIMDYKLAGLIASNVSTLLSKDAYIPSLVEAYEFLFQVEKKIQDEIKAEREMKIWKQRMLDYAETHNRKWGENK